MKETNIQPAPVKGYKVFNADFTCRPNGSLQQYQENTEYKFDGKLKLCATGFHFCEKASHCFSYYSFDSNNIVCEVEGRGQILRHEEDSKICTDLLFVGRRLTWAEVLVAANEGSNNTGHSNSGSRNSGSSNSGSWNSGSWNSGDSNSGSSNSGSWNSGSWNSGSWNSGDSNSGSSNSGSWNSGSRNSGDSNSGSRNSGDSNSGYRNSGDSNSGSSNSGSWNSGSRNSGDSNSGYRNSGAFCKDPDPIMYFFDKPSKMKVSEWERHPAINILSDLDPTLWVPGYMMSDEEKKQNPDWETTEGYLKTIPIKEAWANLWGNMTAKNKKVFTSLPNFDAAIFEDITGIRI